MANSGHGSRTGDLATMTPTVLLGDPTRFHIRSGANPHTRTRWGRLKRVNCARAVAQWERFKTVLEGLGVQVRVVPAVSESPGLVFPANAGFRHEEVMYLSNLNPLRAAEKVYYRNALEATGLQVRDFPVSYPFEGEADFIPAADPSDPRQEDRLYLFTFGRIETPRWVGRLGLPPYRRRYGFRSDRRLLETLQSIVGTQRRILPLELVDEAHYHGDTVLCPFGPREEFLLVYLEGFSYPARVLLQRRFGDRLVALNRGDGRRFAANSFQVKVEREGKKLPVLLMPDGLSQRLYEEIRQRGVVPCPVDVSEFLEKGGGAVKCMLLNLGEL